VNVHAEPLDDAAVHLRDGHLQQHLLLGLDIEHVEHLLGPRREAPGDIHDARGVQRAGCRAGQHHVVVHRL
jgi:hypothetical protein